MTYPNMMLLFYFQVPRDSFKHIVKACECPLYWKMPLFLATQQSLHAPVDGHKFIDFWRELVTFQILLNSTIMFSIEPTYGLPNNIRKLITKGAYF